MIFESILILQHENFTNSYDHADLALIQTLNIEFWPITRDRKKRLKIIGEVVGRTVLSTYDLSVGEVHALLQMLKQSNLVAEMHNLI